MTRLPSEWGIFLLELFTILVGPSRERIALQDFILDCVLKCIARLVILNQYVFQKLPCHAGWCEAFQIYGVLKVQSGIKFVKAKVPYFFLAFTLLPIFFFSMLVPAYADTSFYSALDSDIDRYFFGSVGFGSSNFPLVSKVVANYICLLAPFFALGYSYLIISKSKFTASNFEDAPLRVFLMLPFFLVLLSFFVIYINYLDCTNLIAKKKMSFFGRSEFLYAILSSCMMYLIYNLTLVNILFFRYYPVAAFIRFRRFMSRP